MPGARMRHRAALTADQAGEQAGPVGADLAQHVVSEDERAGRDDDVEAGGPTASPPVGGHTTDVLSVTRPAPSSAGTGAAAEYAETRTAPSRGSSARSEGRLDAGEGSLCRCG
jgi:hypothetical protein